MTNPPDLPFHQNSTAVCECGHPVDSHELLDHDERNAGGADFRRREGLARWHMICTHDTHPDGQGESPWDHVCGCIANVYEPQPGVRMIDKGTSETMRFVLRSVFNREVVDA
jgi:hypothetical protein